MTRPGRIMLCGVTLPFILGGANCLDLHPVLPTADIVGESGDSVLYTGPLSGTAGAPAAKLYEMNLSSGARTAFEAEVPPGRCKEADSDGQYVVWNECGSDVVNVIELASGETWQIPGAAEPSDGPSILDIDTGRLLLGVFDGCCWPKRLKVVDLATGDEQEIEVDGELFWADFSGDHIALFAEPLDHVGEIGLEFSVRFELIDLGTNELVVYDTGNATLERLAMFEE